MSAETHDPELAVLASALAALVPAPGRIDRDQLLFRAGRAAAVRRGWLWPGLTVLFACGAAALAVNTLLHPAPQLRERVVYVPVESSPLSPGGNVAEGIPASLNSDSRSPGDENRWRAQLDYVHLRQQVLRWGVDGLPDLPPAPPAKGPDTVETFINSL